MGLKELVVGLAFTGTLASCVTTDKFNGNVSSTISDKIVEVGYDINLDKKFEIKGYYKKEDKLGNEWKLLYTVYDSDEDGIPEKISFGNNYDHNYIRTTLSDDELKKLKND